MGLKQILNHKVIKAGSWYTFTNLFSNGVVFLTIPIFTRLLTTADYGIVSLYNTWVTIFAVFISLSLTESIKRAKFDYSNKYNEFASSIAFLSIIVFFVYLLIFTLLYDFFQEITALPKLLFVLMIIQAFSSYVKDFAITKFRFEYKYKTASIISVLTVIVGVALSIFLIINVFDK